MIDTHCHIDLYARPTEIAQTMDRLGVATIVVTNLPSAYEKAALHIKQFKKLRLALGLHPLMAAQHATEHKKFARLVDDTFYVGEVGLDFSPQGYQTKELQIESFRFVLEKLVDSPKFVTLHSRRAEGQVLKMLSEARQAPVVFHWYSGALKTLYEILEAGHYFSINPAMTLSPNGRKIIAALPIERVLTETDGPFVKIGNRIAVPTDVRIVEQYLASIWNVTPIEAENRIKQNFSTMLKTLKKDGLGVDFLQ